MKLVYYLLPLLAILDNVRAGESIAVYGMYVYLIRINMFHIGGMPVIYDDSFISATLSGFRWLPCHCSNRALSSRDLIAFLF